MSDLSWAFIAIILGPVNLLFALVFEGSWVGLSIQCMLFTVQLFALYKAFWGATR